MTVIPKASVLVKNETDSIDLSFLTGLIAVIEGDMFDDQLLVIKPNYQVFSKAPTSNNYVAMMSQEITFMINDIMYRLKTNSLGFIERISQVLTTEDGFEEGDIIF